MNDEIELRSCPFCGERPKGIIVGMTGLVMIYCEHCGCRVSFEINKRNDVLNVAQAWNGRSDSKISVGDTVYQTDGVKVYESTVRHVFYDTESVTFDADAIGSSIFLTRKEAEERMEHYGKS